jgi:hypothetical protein
MPVTNSNQEQGGVCSCPLRDTHFEHITCGKEFIQAHDWDQEFCAQPMGGGNRCGHDRACHAPTREQRLQQHIAERDAFLAEDALSAAPEPMVSISLRAEQIEAIQAGIDAIEFASSINWKRDDDEKQLAVLRSMLASTHSQSEEGK